MEGVGQLVRARRAEVAAVLLVAGCACAVLYSGILTSSWTHDDPIIVRHVVAYSPAQLLFDPAVWRDYNWRGFFPLQLLSFWLDRVAFGVAPLGYRIHQLTVLAVLAALVYVAVRRFGSRVAALGAAMALLVGPVSCELAQRLMTRHYLEGAIAALLAWLAVDQRERGGGVGWSVASASLFLLAVLAKEVYAPLPFLLFLVYRRRLRAVADGLGLMLVALGLAVVYRGFMVEGVVRSYRPDALEPGTLLVAAGQLGKGTLRVLTHGMPMWGLLGIAGMLLFVVFVAVSDRHAGFVVGGGAIAAVAPTLLVAEHLEPRHGFHMWLLLVVAIAWCVERGLRKWQSPWVRGTVVTLIVVVGAGLLVGNRVRWSRAIVEATLYTNLWNFSTVEGREGDYLVAPPGVLQHYFVGARWLRLHAGDGQRGPAVVGDRAAWCVVSLPKDARLFEVDDGRVVSVPGGRAGAQRWCSAVVHSAPLSVSLAFSGGQLEWRLGPYDQGEYLGMLLQIDPMRDLLAGTFPVPREGSAWMAPGADRVRLVVVYYSPEGWLALTPPLDMALEDGMTIAWPMVDAGHLGGDGRRSG